MRSRPCAAWPPTASCTTSRQAFLDHAGSQCGFCTPGMLLTVHVVPGPPPARPIARSCAARSPGTCAAAPATPRSSTRSRPTATCAEAGRWRLTRAASRRATSPSRRRRAPPVPRAAARRAGRARSRTATSWRRWPARSPTPMTGALPGCCTAWWCAPACPARGSPRIDTSAARGGARRPRGAHRGRHPPQRDLRGGLGPRIEQTVQPVLARRADPLRRRAGRVHRRRDAGGGGRGGRPGRRRVRGRRGRLHDRRGARRRGPERAPRRQPLRHLPLRRSATSTRRWRAPTTSSRRPTRHHASITPTWSPSRASAGSTPTAS